MEIYKDHRVLGSYVKADWLQTELCSVGYVPDNLFCQANDVFSSIAANSMYAKVRLESVACLVSDQVATETA
jgi:hypothetical protein